MLFFFTHPCSARYIWVTMSVHHTRCLSSTFLLFFIFARFFLLFFLLISFYPVDGWTRLDNWVGWTCKLVVKERVFCTGNNNFFLWIYIFSQLIVFHIKNCFLTKITILLTKKNIMTHSTDKFIIIAHYYYY